jgi:hypothetical protein
MASPLAPLFFLLSLLRKGSKSILLPLSPQAFYILLVLVHLISQFRQFVTYFFRPLLLPLAFQPFYFRRYLVVLSPQLLYLFIAIFYLKIQRSLVKFSRFQCFLIN